MEVTLARQSSTGIGIGKTFRPVGLDEIVTSTDFLPPAFELIPQLLALLDDGENDCEAVADLIRIDPGLTADVLRIANSASFGGARKTACVAEAITRLGLREVCKIVLEIVTAPSLKTRGMFAFQRIDLWRHSLATAVASQTLARHLSDEDPEYVFTAGLLHDIGKALFSRAAGADYFQLMQMCALRNDPVCDAEREEFGLDHGEFGGKLLRNWKFPDAIVAGVSRHHGAMQAGDKNARFAALVYAGNILAYRIGEGNGFPIYAVHPDAGVCELIGLKVEDFGRYEEEVAVMLRRERERLN
jgi:putative nucleotidyltransferase with HDIG domain